ncbi:MAG: hypothetical protein GX675_00010 [Erysipelotrichaceae bacterium]|nr:hypothetical protein [Erysipelotrichaceae bacterium]
MKYSYASDELIEELESDIEEFGNDALMETIVRRIGEYEFIIDYQAYFSDLELLDNDPLDLEEIEETKFILEDGDHVEIFTAIDLLQLLKYQNDIANPVNHKSIKGITLS